jgi:hypothetical protein
MNAIHSFWSVPFYNNKNNCGWLDIKYFYYSWAFSCLQIKKHYKKIVLYTDSKGKEILIDILQLPYDEVYLNLDVIPSHYSSFYSIGKLYAIAHQNEPFIHFDGDVFIWDYLSSLDGVEVFTQNLETDLPFNKLAYENIIEKCPFIPNFLNKKIVQECGFASNNLGIIGGTNYEFLKYYSSLSLNFIDQNIDTLKVLDAE